MSGKIPIKILLLIAIIAAFLTHSPSGPRAADQESGKPPDFLEIEKKWGIRDIAVRLTANGAIVDLRYRITDGKKAEPLLGGKNQFRLFHQATGVELPIATSKFGKLRQIPTDPNADRLYFTLFSSLGGQVKSGDRLTLTMGDMRVENLEVE
jgi:hypothetical protein